MALGVNIVAWCRHKRTCGKTWPSTAPIPSESRASEIACTSICSTAYLPHRFATTSQSPSYSLTSEAFETTPPLFRYIDSPHYLALASSPQKECEHTHISSSLPTADGVETDNLSPPCSLERTSLYTITLLPAPYTGQIFTSPSVSFPPCSRRETTTRSSPLFPSMPSPPSLRAADV